MANAVAANDEKWMIDSEEYGRTHVEHLAPFHVFSTGTHVVFPDSFLK